MLVVGSRLGCINHALLSLATADASNVPVLGYVVNCLDADGDGPASPTSNRTVIARFTAHRDLGLFPYSPEAIRKDFELLGRLAEQHLDLTVFG